MTLPALALAIYGYKQIHQAQKVMTAIFAVVIVVALIQAASYGSVQKADRGFHLSSGPILIAVIGLFFFVPWSAINLVDFYLVKRGRYDVQSFFTPDGIYGRVQWWACICYVITLAVQVPFLDQLFYVGPLAARASLLYLAGAKRSGAARVLPATAGSALQGWCGGGVS